MGHICHPVKCRFTRAAPSKVLWMGNNLLGTFVQARPRTHCKGQHTHTLVPKRLHTCRNVECGALVCGLQFCSNHRKVWSSGLLLSLLTSASSFVECFLRFEEAVGHSCLEPSDAAFCQSPGHPHGGQGFRRQLHPRSANRIQAGRDLFVCPPSPSCSSRFER